MIHPRRHEQPVRRVSRRTHFRANSLEVANAVLRHHLLVRPAVVLDQLAPATEERPQISIGRTEYVIVLRHCFREVAIEVQRVEVPRGILEHDVLEVVIRKLDRLRSTGQSRPHQFAAPLHRWKDLLTGVGFVAGV